MTGKYSVDLDDFELQVLEICLIQINLALEGPIRHPSLTLEHGQGLRQDFLECHGRPPTTTTTSVFFVSLAPVGERARVRGHPDTVQTLTQPLSLAGRGRAYQWRLFGHLSLWGSTYRHASTETVFW